MKDLYDLINIRKVNIEESIIKSIEEVKQELNGLETERMCQVYTSFIYNKLKEKGVLVRIVDTQSDCNLDYKHYFLVVPNSENNNYIIDLTYNQFMYNPLFTSMYKNGYQLLTNDEFEEYINNIKTSTRRKR